MGEPSRRVAMVVDDDPAVARHIAIVLEERGWTVFCAYDADDALRFLARRSVFGTQNIDLLITDVFMPSIVGPMLVRSIREMYPGAGVIYVTGDDGRREADTGGEILLRKPVSGDDLMAAVDQLLGPDTSEHPA